MVEHLENKEWAKWAFITIDHVIDKESATSSSTQWETLGKCFNSWCITIKAILTCFSEVLYINPYHLTVRVNFLIQNLRKHPKFLQWRNDYFFLKIYIKNNTLIFMISSYLLKFPEVMKSHVFHVSIFLAPYVDICTVGRVRPEQYFCKGFLETKLQMLQITLLPHEKHAYVSKQTWFWTTPIIPV